MMNQQADKLRILAADSPRAKKGARQKPRTIVIASGKGGVGKTTISANLAVALSDLGIKCGLIDADFGLADVHVLFGHRPTANLSNIVRDGRDIGKTFDRLPDGPWLLPGVNGDDQMAALDDSARDALLKSFSKILHPMGIILLDAAAGAGPEITDFAIWADELILIVVPDPTSILDCYGLLKVYKGRGGTGPVSIIVNRVERQENHQSIVGALRSTANGFLGMELNDLGSIPEDPFFSSALSARRPLVRFKPLSPASRAIRAIAANLHKRIPHRIS
jgi:flagellar biosynthesis protein FlhG